MEKPVGVFDTHVDTAVATGGAEMVVPRGAVQTVTLIKIHSPGDIRNVVAWAGHAGRFELDVDGEVAGDGGVGGHACGDDELFLEGTVFVSVGTLCREDHHNLFADEDRGFRNHDRCRAEVELLAGIDQINVGNVVC